MNRIVIIILMIMAAFVGFFLPPSAAVETLLNGEHFRQNYPDGSFMVGVIYYDEVVGDRCAMGTMHTADGKVYNLDKWCGDDLLPVGE
jgi:hypothetical protein